MCAGNFFNAVLKIIYLKTQVSKDLIHNTGKILQGIAIAQNDLNSKISFTYPAQILFNVIKGASYLLGQEKGQQEATDQTDGRTGKDDRQQEITNPAHGNVG
jgi:hypothetical protein